MKPVLLISLLYACQPALVKPKGFDVPKAEAKESLLAFTQRLMDDRAGKMPPYKKQLIADSIVRVSEEMFAERERQEQYIVLLAIESGFNPDAKSTAGAIGLSQLMPKYAPGFAKACGIEGLDVADLKHIDLQIKIGACAFKQLLNANGGNLAATLVSYNAGMNSSSFKTLVNGGTIQNVEAANYATKHMYLTQKINAQRGTP
jgi:hypothetical protein